jgi:hypothetical protein
MERSFISLAASTGRPAVVIFDRGAQNGGARHSAPSCAAIHSIPIAVSDHYAKGMGPGGMTAPPSRLHGGGIP